MTGSLHQHEAVSKMSIEMLIVSNVLGLSSGHSMILYTTTELSHFRVIEVIYGYVISKIFSNSRKKRLLACFR